MVVIPADAPSSVNEEHGSVKYNVRVQYVRPWASDDEFVEGFTVVYPINLNLNPFLRNPAESTISKEFGCCCCELEPVSFTVRIPKTGFALGEEMDLKVHINNPTSTGNSTKQKSKQRFKLFVFNFSPEIHHLEVRIMKFVIFEATKPKHKKNFAYSKVFQCNFGEILVNGRRDYAYSFKIPPIVSSTVNPNFHLIKISYTLSIKAKVLIKFIDLCRLFD
jgi:hypothetical protein